MASEDLTMTGKGVFMLKRRILNLAYNAFAIVGSIVLCILPVSSEGDIFSTLQNVKLHYAPVQWLIYLIGVLLSFTCGVLAFVSRDVKREDVYTQKSLAFLVVSSFVLLGAVEAVDKRAVSAIPFCVSMVALLAYHFISGKEW